MSRAQNPSQKLRKIILREFFSEYFGSEGKKMKMLGGTEQLGLKEQSEAIRVGEKG